MLSSLLLLLAAAGISFAQNSTTARSRPTSEVSASFSNGARFKFDVDGNHIAGTNGIVDYINGQYLFIQEPNRDCGLPRCSIVTYSSPDLKHWTPNGALFDINDPTNLAACSGIIGTCSRPKILYNPSTKKYVFYGFDGKIGNPGIPVFTSDSLTSGYTYVGRSLQEFRPFGWMAEDLGLRVIDGSAYLVFTALDLVNTVQGNFGSIWPPFINQLYLQKLTPDYLNGTGPTLYISEGPSPVTQNSTNLIDGQVQSPDIFKRGNTYYVIGSGTCAVCNGTTTIAYRSKSLQGPWKRQIVQSQLTCGGQGLGVLTIPATSKCKEPSYIYHTDAISTAPNGLNYATAHGHDFFKLEFNRDGSIKPLNCDPKAGFTVTVPRGLSSLPTSGRATTATDGSGNYAPYVAQNNFPSTFFYQTWTSSKTGVLSEIGLNLAANAANFNATIIAFRYPNEQALLSPFFRWEQLGSYSVGLNVPVKPSFGVVRVPLNAQVKKGDRLGFALTPGPRVSAASLPYGYLIGPSQNPDHKLYQLTRGHISLGEDGVTKPITLAKGQELKWYAIVN